MQFTTPLYERSDIYESYSEAHAASHPQETPASQAERTVELTRVVDVGYSCERDHRLSPSVIT